MGKKMYYTEEEAAQKLGVEPQRLGELVRDSKLRAFKDGPRIMYRVDEIDALAASGELIQEEEIELTPADSSSGSVAGLARADQPTGGGKDDTVITAEGISIFDEEDLEIDTADPMAKTHVAMSLEEQVGVEGAGTGSGLLDLTRESDDTSLGAVLERIDSEPAGRSAAGDLTGVGQAAVAVQAAQPTVPMVVEEPDPMAGVFSGLAGGAAVLALLLAGTTFTAATETVPGFVSALGDNLLMAWLVCLVVLGVGAGLGWFLGKSAAARQ